MKVKKNYYDLTINNSNVCHNTIKYKSSYLHNLCKNILKILIKFKNLDSRNRPNNIIKN